MGTAFTNAEIYEMVRLLEDEEPDHPNNTFSILEIVSLNAERVGSFVLLTLVEHDRSKHSFMFTAVVNAWLTSCIAGQMHERRWSDVFGNAMLPDYQPAREGHATKAEKEDWIKDFDRMKPSPQDNFALRKELPFVVAINNKANGHSLLLTFRLRSGEDRSFVLNTEVVVRLFRMIYLTAIEGGWIAPDFNITGGIPTKL